MNPSAHPLHDPLGERELRVAVAALAAADADMARALADVGLPPLRPWEPGFPTLLRIILGHQVSLASARAIFARLQAAAHPLTPERLLALDDETLRAAGLSRAKTIYARALAEEIVHGRLDLDALDQLPDDDARAQLVAVHGIGAWTADLYLLLALRRPDIWPAGDLALAIAARAVKGLEGRPNFKEMVALAEPWRPWRGAAARLLWHYYRQCIRPDTDYA